MINSKSSFANRTYTPRSPTMYSTPQNGRTAEATVQLNPIDYIIITANDWQNCKRATNITPGHLISHASVLRLSQAYTTLRLM